MTWRLLLATDLATAYSTCGTKNTWAPAFSTATVFSCTPPTSPTSPCGSIVPVAATRWPPVNFPFERASRIARVNARPADGPPIPAGVNRHREGQHRFDAGFDLYAHVGRGR